MLCRSFVAARERAHFVLFLPLPQIASSVASLRSGKTSFSLKRREEFSHELDQEQYSFPRTNRAQVPRRT